MKVFKRIFIALLVLLVFTCGIFFYAKQIEPNLLTINQVSLPSTKKTKQLKIVFFCDTHFGKLYAPDKIESIVEKINKEKPDLIIFGGDFFDAYSRDEAMLDLDYFSEQLANMQSTYGKFAVWGNHDLGGGSARIYQNTLEQGGFTLLQNETITLSELNMTITGLDDYLLGKPDTKITETLSPDFFNLLISHAPDVVDGMDTETADFILAGHSHGGQVYVPFLTSLILPTGAKYYPKGMYALDNPQETALFVSKGLGMTHMPYRFLNAPEIVTIELETQE